MFKALFKKVNQRQRKAKKASKNIETLEEKKAKWNSRWKSEEYNPFWDLGVMPENIRNLIDNGNIPKGATIVDIGCGSGYLSACLAEQGFHVVGFDFAKTAVERANMKYSEVEGDLTYCVADATRPFPLDYKFRIGIDRGTYHTLPMENRKDYVENMGRIIENGGHLIILYAFRIAKQLTVTTQCDPAILLKEHIIDLFNSDFEIEQYQEIMMEGNTEDDAPGFMIILRRTPADRYENS